MFTIQKLEEEISNEKFLLRGAAFIENGSLKFTSKKEVKDFLVKFLLVECIAGVNYTRDELILTYRKVKKLCHKKVISSEGLPVLSPKRQADKALCDVCYIRKGCICLHKKDCA